jgi:hypothetical protein
VLVGRRRPFASTALDQSVETGGESLCGGGAAVGARVTDYPDAATVAGSTAGDLTSAVGQLEPRSDDDIAWLLRRRSDGELPEAPETKAIIPVSSK